MNLDKTVLQPIILSDFFFLKKKKKPASKMNNLMKSKSIFETYQMIFYVKVNFL